MIDSAEIIIPKSKSNLFVLQIRRAQELDRKWLQMKLLPPYREKPFQWSRIIEITFSYRNFYREHKDLTSLELRQVCDQIQQIFVTFDKASQTVGRPRVTVMAIATASTVE